ncbi:hypothetical protein [Actinomadura harenae]|uniref:Uncharacterized protein n=1 Tax=Actinomadura harenae TaxID=2483351 RepID=A0A3M2M277_9ACTN|nr:hypothetical protein [Actinomadura harenae]RMI41198.1 hypothetical protein EBO15_24040 [Actinomadura harenae]
MPDELPPFDDDFIAGASISEPSARQRARRRRRPRLRIPRPPRRSGGETMGYLKASGLVGGVVLVLGAAATGMWWLGRDDASKPSSTTLRLASPAPAPSDYFAGSPAAAYQDGEAGIAMPAAQAMAGLTSTDVEAAYARIKRILVAADLDPATVYAGDVKPLAATLDPEQAKGLSSRRVWTNAFAPGSAVAATPTVKVHGTVTPSAAKDGLSVRTDHNFVYAVHPPQRADLVQRVVVRRSVTFTVTRDGGDVRVWISQMGRSAAPAPCMSTDGWIHPTYPGDPGGGGTSQTEDPYDMSQPPVFDGGCRQVTGT